MTTVSGFFEEHWLGLLQTATSMLVVWGGWSLKRLFVTRQDFEADRAGAAAARKVIEERLESVEAKQAQRDNDMAAIREKMDGLPNEKTVYDINLQLVEIQGEMSRTCEELRGLREIVVRVERQTDLLYRKGLESEK